MSLFLILFTLTCSIILFLSCLLPVWCVSHNGHPCSVYEVVWVPCCVLGTVVEVTLMCVIFCVRCECVERMTAMLVWGLGGRVVALSEYMDGTRGSDIVSSAYAVLDMSVVHG